MRSWIIAVALLAGCNQKSSDAKVPGTNCTYQENACRGGGCCPRATDCGGVWPNCPADQCCAAEDDGRVFGGTRDAGPRMTPKRYP